MYNQHYMKILYLWIDNKKNVQKILEKVYCPMVKILEKVCPQAPNRQFPTAIIFKKCVFWQKNDHQSSVSDG